MGKNETSFNANRKSKFIKRLLVLLIIRKKNCINK